MKGTIVEIRSKKSAMLSTNGNVFIVPNKNYEVGQEISYSNNKFISKKLTTIASVAAALIIFLGIGAYIHMANTAYYYVTIDVNPSIELVLNKNGKVVEVNAYNDDGEKILENIEDELVFSAFNQLDYEEAATIILDQINELGYFEDEVDVVITTSNIADLDNDDLEENSNDNEEEILSTIASVANNIAEKENKEIQLVAESIGTTLVSEARELDVSPGKLLIVQKMMDAAEETDTDDIDFETALYMSVKDIMAQTKQYKEEIKEYEKNSEDDTEIQEENEDAVANDKSDSEETEDETTTSKTNNGKSNKTDSSSNNNDSEDSNNDNDDNSTSNGNSNSEKNSNNNSNKTDNTDDSDDSDDDDSDDSDDSDDDDSDDDSDDSDDSDSDDDEYDDVGNVSDDDDE